jgi:hypothetical protein
MTFSETANRCNVFPDGFATMKNVAKQLIDAKLIKDNRIDPRAERMFLSAREGKIFKDPETIQVTVNTSAPASTKAADILVKGTNIYNNGVLVGSFKKSVTDNITSLKVYNTDNVSVATATHADNDPNADWDIINVSDNKKYQMLYTDATSFDKLFKFLVEKGIL